MLTEGGREVGVAGEADGVCHFAHVRLVVCQQVSCLFQTERADEDIGRYAIAGLHLAVQVYTADAHFFAELLHREV